VDFDAVRSFLSDEEKASLDEELKKLLKGQEDPNDEDGDLIYGTAEEIVAVLKKGADATCIIKDMMG